MIASGRFAGTSTPRVLDTVEHAEFMLPYPSPERVGLLKTPTPPLFPAEATVEERVQWAVRAFCGAWTSRARQRVHIFAGDIIESPHYAALVKGSAALRDAGIAPASWCGFSVDVWRDHTAPNLPARQRHKLVPPSWVFNPQRVRERADWYWSSAAYYAGGHLITLPAARRLVALWNAARERVLRLPHDAPAALVEREVHAVVPGGLEEWERQCDAARDVCQQQQESLNARAAAGEFVW
jgi:hypothetical protein